MKSNDEEYLDSLLSSARNSNNSNPMSALSRMSGRTAASGPAGNNGSGDIGALVNNSNGNKDLNDIGSILDRLDRDELVDDRLSDLLDSISKPTDSRIPKFTIGGTPSAMDVRDPEEIALDEAIAECQGQRNPDSKTCMMLAAFLTIKKELYPEHYSPPGYSFAPAAHLLFPHRPTPARPLP